VSGTPADAPVLVAANHISWLDILALDSVCAMSFVGKAEIDQWPVFSYAARTGNTIFHQRGCHSSASDVTTVMTQRLKLGQRVAIFPEGGILAGHSIRTFHARMFRAAVDAECPVQPVMVRYVNKKVGNGDISFRVGENMMMNMVRVLAHPRSEVEVHFLPVIDATGQPRRTLADAARTAVVSRYEDYSDNS
jgi:1-acyl-sn-glycerol-3-phosphate acyltransferase